MVHRLPKLKRNVGLSFFLLLGTSVTLAASMSGCAEENGSSTRREVALSRAFWLRAENDWSSLPHAALVEGFSDAEVKQTLEMYPRSVNDLTIDQDFLDTLCWALGQAGEGAEVSISFDVYLRVGATEFRGLVDGADCGDRSAEDLNRRRAFVDSFEAFARTASWEDLEAKWEEALRDSSKSET
jgi:hypothetical protein